MKEHLKREAGQSGEERLRTVVEQDFLPYVLISIFMVSLTAFEWLRHILNTPPQPVIVTLVTSGCIAFSWYRYRKLKPVFAGMRLGIQGEREVGQILSETLQEFSIIHDIQCPDFNIDHVLIGEKGVYSVETKTWSKGEGDKVIYDGTSILVNGYPPERDPLVQAQANSRTIKKLIFDLTGIQVAVQPVVLFPGWWVETKVKDPKVLVLNPGQVPQSMRGKPSRLTSDQVHVIVSALKRSQATYSNPTGVAR